MSSCAPYITHPARPHAGQPTAAPPGGGSSPARGRGLPFALKGLPLGAPRGCPPARGVRGVRDPSRAEAGPVPSARPPRPQSRGLAAEHPVPAPARRGREAPGRARGGEVRR